MFDPNSKEYAGEGGGDRINEAGDYLFVIPKFTRDRANSGKQYLLCKVKAIAGRFKDATLLDRVYLNDEALWRLAHLCKAIGHDKPFDIKSDRDVRAAICNRPFKAKVVIKREGEKSFANIERFIFEPSDKECAIMDEWAAEFAANRQMDGGDDDGPGAPPHTDDDIPF